MKATLVLALSFLLTLFAFLTNLSLAFSVDQVRDINGDGVFPGLTYFIVPANFQSPWLGLKLGQTGNSNCNLTVLQDYKLFHGLPMKFLIPGITLGIIFTGTPIDITFVDKTSCAESSKWLVFVDETMKKECVGIRGTEGHPGEQIFSGKFHFEQSKKGYKVVFCKNGSPTCSYLGRFDAQNGENERRLILTENANEAVDIFIVPNLKKHR